METKLNFSSSFEVAEVDLVYRRSYNPNERPLLLKSENVYELLLQHWDQDKISFVEQFKVVLVNQANRVLALYEMATGGITSVVVDIRLAITAALLTNATAMILAHNHPSGRMHPSKSDQSTTETLKQAAKLFNITLQDHLIISGDSYFSFADNGIL